MVDERQIWPQCCNALGMCFEKKEKRCHLHGGITPDVKNLLPMVETLLGALAAATFPDDVLTCLRVSVVANFDWQAMG